MNKFFTSIIAVGIFTNTLSAQNVGIGTNTPLDKLHVVGAVRSTTLSSAGYSQIVADANGTIVIGAPATLNAWSTKGNAGTVAGTNFLGTTDLVDFIIKTGGIAAANERIRTLSAGQTVVNAIAIQVGDVFSVYSNSYVNGVNPTPINALGDWAINGYTNVGAGVYGEAVGTTGTGAMGLNLNATQGTGVFGANAGSTTGNGVFGSYQGTAAAGMGVRGQATTIGSLGVGVGGFSVSTGIGVYGQNTGLGYGVYGANNAGGTGVFGAGQLGADGVTGFANNALGFSVWGFHTLTNGTGVVGGNGNQSFYLVNGSGGAFTGDKIAGYFKTLDSSLTNNTLKAGALINIRSSGPTNASWYVGLCDATNTLYKVLGPGVVSTVVNDLNDKKVIMCAPEGPEAMFEDYGSSQLVNGKAKVQIDPIFTKNIIVNEQHPLRVFVQLEGDCKGVFVSNKSATGFDITELQNGNSNVSFTYKVIANRADEIVDGGVIPYSQNRFAKAPDAQAAKSTTIKNQSESLPQVADEPLTKNRR